MMEVNCLSVNYFFSMGISYQTGSLNRERLGGVPLLGCNQLKNAAFGKKGEEKSERVRHLAGLFAF